MCKLCNTKHRKTFEILTDLSPAVWPPHDAQCIPSSPCDQIKDARERRQDPRFYKHEDTLEWGACTASAEYPRGLCDLLATAIFKHHGIPLRP